MQNSTVVAVIVAAALGVGVGLIAAPKTGAVTMHKHSHDVNPCKTETQCKVQIAVDCDDMAHPTPASCDSYADKAEVTQVGATTTSFLFKITTGSFEFDQADGIKFSTLNNGNQYFTCTPDSNKQKYNCTASGVVANMLYKYSIHVANLDPVDPWVVNY